MGLVSKCLAYCLPRSKGVVYFCHNYDNGDLLDTHLGKGQGQVFVECKHGIKSGGFVFIVLKPFDNMLCFP